MTDKKETPEVLKWRGHKVYRCRLCAFDSTDKAKFEDHFRKMHAPFQIIDGGKTSKTASTDDSPKTTASKTSGSTKSQDKES